MECMVMGQRFHRGFTAAEKTELWDRWKRGESLKAIGRAFGKPSSSIYFLVAPHGGIRPAQRRRSRLALTLVEREGICRGVTAHRSARSMAKLLGRSPSTVSREMSRNGGHYPYLTTLAAEGAWPLGRRSPVRAEQQVHRDLGRASYALRDVGQGGRHVGDQNRRIYSTALSAAATLALATGALGSAPR